MSSTAWDEGAGGRSARAGSATGVAPAAPAGMSACAFLCTAAVRMVMFCLGVWRALFVLLCCVPGTSVFV
eukprot:5836920-Prymnesium_polylepis.1